MSQLHKSSTSHYSRSLSQFNTDIEELTDTELIKKVNDLKKQTTFLQLENEILEKTILRLEPSLMNGVQQALEYAQRLQSQSTLRTGSFLKSQTSRFGFDSLLSPSRMLASPSRVSTRRAESSAKLGSTVFIGSGPRINVLERSELVSKEIEILIQDLEKIRNKADKQQALLKAKIEEVRIRVADVQKYLEMFNQEVIVDGWDKIAQRIPAEIWIRFMSEWLKSADSQIGKLRLRTSTLNTQISKLKGQIKFKAELSESLRPVDFEKIKIENKICEEVIEKKQQQLEELKKMTGEANLNLTIHKKLMVKQNKYLRKISDSIKTKEIYTKQLDKERDIIHVEAEALAQRLNEIREVRLAYEVPNVMDYVKVKAETTDLKKTIKILENRLRIQYIALTSLNRKLRTISY